MPNTTQCPSCGQQYDITPEYAGKRVECACGVEFTVPEIQKKTMTPLDVSGAKKVPLSLTPTLNMSTQSTTNGPFIPSESLNDLRPQQVENSADVKKKGLSPLFICVAFIIFLTGIGNSYFSWVRENKRFEATVKELLEVKTLENFRSVASKHNLSFSYATRLYRKRKEDEAQNGDPAVQKLIGDLYREEEKYSRAQYWYQKSANQGYAGAQHNLALIYYHGLVELKDYRRAQQLLEKSAAYGIPESKYVLGQLYCQGGYGVSRDQDKGIKLIEDSASMGYQRARDFLSKVTKPTR